MKKNHFELTPLHLATLGREAEIAEMLLEAGASPEYTTPSGYTALHLTSAHPNLLLGLEGKTAKNLKEDRSNAQETRELLLAHSSTQGLECYFAQPKKNRSSPTMKHPNLQH